MCCGQRPISSEVYARPGPRRSPWNENNWSRRSANLLPNSAQTIFADRTYPKPFFVTYTNTSMFIMPLFFILGRRTWALWRHRKLSQITSLKSLLRHLDSHDPKAEEESMLNHGSDEEDGQLGRPSQDGPGQRLGLKATAKLSVQFCLLWVSMRSCLLEYLSGWLTHRSLPYVAYLKTGGFCIEYILTDNFSPNRQTTSPWAVSSSQQSQAQPS